MIVLNHAMKKSWEIADQNERISIPEALSLSVVQLLC